MWNNAFILTQSQHLADRVSRELGEKFQPRLERVFQLILARLPTEQELKELMSYSKQYGMTNVCRLLFNTNEFLFVD